jgi:hypothetical protein
MMKERPGSKLVRGARQESRRFRLLVIVVGFFLVSLTFVVVSKPDAILFGRKPPIPLLYLASRLVCGLIPLLRLHSLANEPTITTSSVV